MSESGSETGGWEGRDRIRLCVRWVLDRNLSSSSAEGVVWLVWKVRIDEVRNFMSSRISATSIVRENVPKMLRKRMPEGRSGDSRKVG